MSQDAWEDVSGLYERLAGAASSAAASVSRRLPSAATVTELPPADAPGELPGKRATSNPEGSPNGVSIARPAPGPDAEQGGAAAEAAAPEAGAMRTESQAQQPVESSP